MPQNSKRINAPCAAAAAAVAVKTTSPTVAMYLGLTFDTSLTSCERKKKECDGLQ